MRVRRVPLLGQLGRVDDVGKVHGKGGRLCRGSLHHDAQVTRHVSCEADAICQASRSLHKPPYLDLRPMRSISCASRVIRRAMEHLLDGVQGLHVFLIKLRCASARCTCLQPKAHLEIVDVHAA
jgi:hypothetical protein